MVVSRLTFLHISVARISKHCGKAEYLVAHLVVHWTSMSHQRVFGNCHIFKFFIHFYSLCTCIFPVVCFNGWLVWKSVLQQIFARAKALSQTA